MPTWLIGLDCVPPRLVFEFYRELLPNLNRLARSGVSGSLRSTSPPITIPAWVSMASGLDPGQLGLYGFRKRNGYQQSFVSGEDVKAKRLWDYVTDHQLDAAALFCPLTYPPSHSPTTVIGGFLSGEYPCNKAQLFESLEAVHGKYLPDVEAFRRGDRQRIFSDLMRMLEQHFAYIRAVVKQGSLDFLHFVEIGTDRLHHAFWDKIDPTHPRYQDDAYAQMARTYYEKLDDELGALLDMAPDNTSVLVVSDHGAQPMHDTFAINQWLVDQGYLKLLIEPEVMSRGLVLEPEDIDWAQTSAWSQGGYCARIFINQQGREPRGIVESYRTVRLIDEIRKGLETELAEVRLDIPEQIYKRTLGQCPDAIVYANNLATRFLGTVGYNSPHQKSDDRGFDVCNHAWEGVLIANDVAGIDRDGRGGGRSWEILDVAPTVLDTFGIDAPGRMAGQNLRSLKNRASVRSA